MTHQDLATRARDLAARAPRGTLDRRATGCVAVALGTTRTVEAARKVLSEIEAIDIRSAAGRILDQLLGLPSAPGQEREPS